MDGALIAALLSGTFALVAAILSAVTTARINSIRRGLQVEIAVPRIEAYRNLWDLTRRASAATPASQDERNALEGGLFAWYFTAGQGIFLSDRSRDILHGLQAQLRNQDIDWDIIKAAYGTLRLSLKDDVGIFGGRRSVLRRRFRYSDVELSSLERLVPE